MPRRAAARIAGRARGRSQHPPVLLLPVERALRWLNGREFDGRHAPRRRAAPQRTESPAVVHDQCGPRLHLVGPHHDHALRRGIAAHPPRLAARFRAGGRNLRARRAVHRPASPGQRTPHCHARSLQGRGNTVLVVEHDEATIREADHIIELGPGSGAHGGDMVYHGSFENLIKHSETLTAKYMGGSVRTHPRRTPRTQGLAHPARGHDQQPQGYRLPHSARHADLRDRGFRLGQKLTRGGHAVQAPRAGAGHPRGSARQHPGHRRRGGHRAHRGHRSTPIGRTPRSNPATYTKIFDEIRQHLRHDPGRPQARLPAGAVQLQRQGRTLRGVQRRRSDPRGNALPARRVRHLRRVRGQALQSRNPRSPLSGAEHLGSAGHART